MGKTGAYVFVCLTVIFTVIGQLLIKWQAGSAGALPAGWSSRIGFLFNLLVNPWIIVGLFCAVIAALAWILAMTRLPLGVAYPMMSLTYPLVICGGWLLFRESLSQWQLMGAALILAGVALVGLR
jgi:multidrug transporter EmrE-like cation transporter